MIRLIALLALAPGCLAIEDGDTPTPYEVPVSWTMVNPPTNGYGVAIVRSPDDEVEAQGFSGTVRLYGESFEPDIDVCVDLSHRYVEVIQGREVPIYAPIGQRCTEVRTFGTQPVSFTF